jgi:hypothetical protein
MKKFEVIITDPVTNYDRYPTIRLLAPSFVDLACRLENSKVSFRAIIDVTKCFVDYDFTPDPFPVGQGVV